MAYTWPKTPLQQLRAVLCVALLGAMRLLNLAVPILYRDVVNTFRCLCAPDESEYGIVPFEYSANLTLVCLLQHHHRAHALGWRPPAGAPLILPGPYGALCEI